jgi:trimethylamine:corrinoid methyltransferase-like protein
MYSEYFPGNGITDRNDRATWAENGELDAWQRARAIVKARLEQEEAPLIPDDVDARIREKFRILL